MDYGLFHHGGEAASWIRGKTCSRINNNKSSSNISMTEGNCSCAITHYKSPSAPATVIGPTVYMRNIDLHSLELDNG